MARTSKIGRTDQSWHTAEKLARRRGLDTSASVCHRVNAHSRESTCGAALAPTRGMRSALVLVVLLGACVVDATEVEQSLDQPPTPAARCAIGCASPHVVGEPILIATSYHGLCGDEEDLCDAQPYTATITCSSCSVALTYTGLFEKHWTVTPFAPGPMSIRVVIENKTFNLAPITSLVPDQLVATCTQASGAPCAAAQNIGPVEVRFIVRANGVDMHAVTPPTVTSNGAGWLDDDTWTTESTGAIVVQGQYVHQSAAFGATMSVDIAHAKEPLPARLDTHQNDAGSRTMD
jgi:hypothetical protein